MVVTHEAEDIIVDVAEEVDLVHSVPLSQNPFRVTTYIGLYPPIPIKVLQSGMLVEETAIPTAHVTVADHPSFAHANRPKILEAVHKSSLIDPVRKRPVLVRNNLVVAFCRGKVLGSLLEDT